jgi:hypothetical protein
MYPPLNLSLQISKTQFLTSRKHTIFRLLISYRESFGVSLVSSIDCIRSDMTLRSGVVVVDNVPKVSEEPALQFRFSLLILTPMDSHMGYLT